MDLLKLFISSAGGAIVAGFFVLVQWKLNRNAHKEDQAAKNEENFCFTRGQELKQMKAEVGNLTIAMRAILYDRIKYLAKSYIKRGWITVEEYEDLKRMHSVYHNELKGNGFLDDIMHAVEQLEKRVR